MVTTYQFIEECMLVWRDHVVHVACDISIMAGVSQCYMRMIRTSILSLLLAGGLRFCFRIQELVVEICVDSVVSSIVYISTVERYEDGKRGVWKVVEGREVLGTGCENVFIYSFVVEGDSGSVALSVLCVCR